MDNTDILIKIRKIVRSINLESKRILKDYGVSIPQILCLNFLNGSPNFQSTQGEIRDFLNLNASTTSGIVQRLEKKGLIARLPKSGDKRVVNIVLTSQGAELYNKIPPILHEKLSHKLTELSSDKLTAIKDSLETLIELLNVNDVDAVPVISIDDTLD